MNKQLKRIYKEIPEIQCQGKCTEACGVIMASDIEMEIISKRVGYNPFMGGQLALLSGSTSCLSCPMLKDGRCSIYDIRPLICRLFGVTERLKCQWGCKPKKWLSDDKARELLRKAAKIK